MDAADFLSAIQGVARADLPPDIKLATIDPAYVVGGSYPTSVALPKVTFDGETTLSTKLYPVLNGYIPVPSQRVVMIPVGRTYVVAGPVGVVDHMLNRSSTVLLQSGYEASIDRPPGCKVRINGTLGFFDGIAADLPWNAQAVTDYESGGVWHSHVTNPDRLTVPAGMGGLMDVGWAITWPASGTGFRSAHLRLNGNNIAQGEPILQVNGLFGVRVSGFAGMVPANDGDYFTVNGYQNSGGSMNVLNELGATYLSVMRRASF